MPFVKESKNEPQTCPIHPGAILLEEFLKPMNISQYRLAKDISVPPRRINEIVHGLRAPSARILRQGCPVFSGCRKGFGLICKRAMILKLKRTAFKTGWIKRRVCMGYRYKTGAYFLLA